MSPDDSDLRALAGEHPSRTIGRRIIVLESVESTNEAAREIALAEGARAHGAVVIAVRQTGGRGTRGRRWWSPPGTSLAMSVVLAPRPPLARPAVVTLVAALAVLDAGVAHGARLAWKWPNDVVDPKGRKVCGVLAESIPGPIQPIHVLGVGVNVLDPVESPPVDSRVALETIASIVSAGGSIGSPAAFVPPLLRAFERELSRLEAHGTAAIASCCNTRSFLAGRRVRLRRGDEVVEGRFVAVDPDLQVRVATDAGDEVAWPGEQVELMAPR